MQISLSHNSDKGSQNVATFQLFSSDDFLKIMNFAEKLETGPYLVEIESITIKSLSNQSNAKNLSGKVDATFVINVFTK